MSRANHIGEIEHGAGESAENEPELHRERQPCGCRFRKLPLPRDLRRSRRHSEPQRHPQKKRDGEEDERAPATHRDRRTAARNSARLWVPLFSKMLRTWVFTVSGEMPISRAIPSLDRPR